jgi:hypothetical protein
LVETIGEIIVTEERLKQLEEEYKREDLEIREQWKELEKRRK